MILQSVFFLVTILLGINSQNEINDLKLGWTIRYPCEATNKITYYSETAESNDGEFNFFMSIQENLEKDTIINITFATPVTLNKSDVSTVFYFSRHDKLNVHLLSSQDKLLLRLKTSNGQIPEIESLLINALERCKRYSSSTTEKLIPLSELNNKFNSDIEPLPKPAVLRIPEDLYCGVRKVDYTQLITNGLDTKPGDWPWHVAIYKLQDSSINYICGGTLISKNFVLTAAHCATEGGVALIAKSLSVVLGKYDLLGSKELSQDIKVSEIIVYPKYSYKSVDNDIALLRLKTPAKFNDYVQPACLWKPELYKYFPASDEILGTVVGWGFTQKDELATELQLANLPKISNLKCIKSNPLFFAQALNGNNFCAGWRNGTSACNGDSGGGFHVNVPDSTSPDALKRWHVQGITSKSVSRKTINLCDPMHYVIFTDVGKFINWIYENLVTNL